jgi:hypothetical protein
MRHMRILPVLLTLAVALVHTPAADAQSTAPDFALPAWSDVSWRDPSNFLTIHTADIDGDGDDELFGRSHVQIEVFNFDPNADQWTPLPSVDQQGTFGDEDGWGAPEYYSTIQAGNLDGQPGDEIFARNSAGIIAYHYNRTTQTWTALPPLTASFQDSTGWTDVKYYSTIHAADLDGDGQDEIFGRGRDGIQVFKYDAAAREWDTFPGVDDFSDRQGWSPPEYYSTIQAADIDGDGADEIFGRGAGGILAVKYDPATGKWHYLPDQSGPDVFSDANGWNHVEYYSTIQPANLDGQPGDEIMARGASGVASWHFNANAQQWIELPYLDGPSDGGGWNHPQYYRTIMHGDVDGDGQDEVLGRGAGGVQVWKLNGSGWDGMPGATDFCDTCGWNLDYHYPSLQMTRTGMNQADQLIGRGMTGVVTYNFDTQANQWGPASAKFPTFTGDGVASYQAINLKLGGGRLSFDVRQTYSTASSDLLQTWAAELNDMPTPPNVNGSVFNTVRTQIMTELDAASVVADWYDDYLTGFTNDLYILDFMDQSASALSYDAHRQTQLGMEELEVFESMLGALNVFGSAPDDAGVAAVVVNSLLGSGMAAGLGQAGLNSAVDLEGTYEQIQDQLKVDFQTAIEGNGAAKTAIQGDYGLLTTVAELIDTGAWSELSNTEQTKALASAQKAYSVGVWQTIAPAIWVAYEIPPSDYDAWCTNNVCDWQSGGNYWQLAWNRSVGGAGCNTLSAALGPCESVLASIRGQLFGQTSGGCQSTWSALNCNLGQSFSDVFLGQNGWEDLPAYGCSDTGWFSTMNCSPLRGSEPGAARQAARMNLGGAGLTVGGARWLGCRAERGCQSVVRAGLPLQQQARSAIKGVKRPAGQAVYRTGWRGRPGRRGTEAFRLELPAADGAYRLRLHFAERRRTSDGRHLFDVNIEGGGKELSGFDVMAAAGGRNRAIVREFPVRVSDGSVTVRFLRGKGAPTVSGVELLPVSGNAATPAASRLRLRASGGRRVKLSGRLRAAGPHRRRLIAIELRGRGGRDFRTAATVRTRPNGTFTLRLKRRSRAVKVRASFAGDGAARPAVSRALSVKGAAAGGGGGTRR